MGIGGFITFYNSTDSDWKRSGQHSYQMEAWSFPEAIRAGEHQKVYIEWQTGMFITTEDDSGEVTYTLADGSAFTLQARAKHDFMLDVCFSNLVTVDHPQGTTVPLGWKHDGNVDFILAGKTGHYVSTGLNGADWMQNNISLLGNLPLRNMCITGSHDAGMSVFTSGTAGAFECNTLTQSNSIRDQLMLGARYFDIRPVISAGQYYTGHYGYLLNTSWQGANGQSVRAVIDDINNFTSQHRELIVLNLSHSLNTDAGRDYRAFTQQEWDGLFSELRSISDLYISSDPDVDLTRLTLGQFISGQPAVVVILELDDGDKDKIHLPAGLQGQGFYLYSSFNAYNSYAEKNDVGVMADDQFGKMRENMPSSYFLLSWTLTQSPLQATTCKTGLASSIRELADEANEQLATLLSPQVTRNNYPNIIYVDNVISTGTAAMAMSVNWLVNG